MAIVTMEGEYETAPKRLHVTSLYDIFKVTIIQRQITRKLYNIELYLQWPTNIKSYMIYRRRYFQ